MKVFSFITAPFKALYNLGSELANSKNLFTSEEDKIFQKAFSDLAQKTTTTFSSYICTLLQEGAVLVCDSALVIRNALKIMDKRGTISRSLQKLLKTSTKVGSLAVALVGLIFAKDVAYDMKKGWNVEDPETLSLHKRELFSALFLAIAGAAWTATEYEVFRSRISATDLTIFSKATDPLFAFSFIFTTAEATYKLAKLLPFRKKLNNQNLYSADTEKKTKTKCSFLFKT